MFKHDSLRSDTLPPGSAAESVRKSSQPRNRISGDNRGFSLVEVTMAIGITTFSAMVLLAMLCSGMNHSRDAADRTVSAQIAQQLIGMAQQANWSQVPELASNYFYFDEAGQLVKGRDDFSAIFAACILVDPSVTFPSEAGGGVNDQVATIRVRVVRDPSHKLSGAPQPELTDDTMRAASQEFQAFLANNGS